MEYKKTRSDLLKLTRARVLVLYGESILKKKTVLLTATLISALLNYRKELDSENTMIRAAMEQIDFALSIDGAQSVLSASNLITSAYYLDFKKELFIGTVVPAFFLKDFAIKRLYGRLATSLRIVESSLKFGDLFSEIVENANIYLRIKKLAEAIFRTRARYNSIDKKLLPALNRQRSVIKEFLEAEDTQGNFNIRSVAKLSQF